MFRKSRSNQSNLFSAAQHILCGSSLKYYESPESWHNQFYQNITTKIDESIFIDLYSSNMGAPNASIRTMIAMMILKESAGMSDEQLFEDCNFHILYRRAIGIFNMDDPIPSKSTYYKFRKMVVEHSENGNPNLISKVFSQITSEQCIEFNVSGKSIRMDSKLIGSNIAKLSRYKIVHDTLDIFYRYAVNNQILTMELDQIISSSIDSDSEDTAYKSNTSEIKNKLQLLGNTIYKVLSLVIDDGSSELKMLQRVFTDQFSITESGEIILKEGKEISAKSLQSPHDPDCDYRNKAGNKVKGYSINVTESCDDGNLLNLIGDCKLSEATTPDTDFFQESAEAAQQVFGVTAKEIHTDGAFHSEGSEEYCNRNNINHVLSSIQGKEGRYRLELIHEELYVWDNKENKYVDVQQVKSRNGKKKWKIAVGNRWRYFTLKDVRKSQIRQNIKNLPENLRNKRNNVEATIFQLSYHYPHGKSRYRGLERNRIWVVLRCLWINFVRIRNFSPDLGGAADSIASFGDIVHKNLQLFGKTVLKIGILCCLMQVFFRLEYIFKILVVEEIFAPHLGKR